MKGIYKFYWDYGRMGEIEGIFVETQANVHLIEGKDVNFGEVLGKHSEVYDKIDIGDITLVTDDQDAVAMFERYNMNTGYNPFHYWDEDYEDEDLDVI